MQTHTKNKIQDMLDVLFERHAVLVDPNVGGKCNNAESLLAQRLAARLGEVMDAGGHVQVASDHNIGDHASKLGGDDNLCRKSLVLNSQAFVTPKKQPVEVPHDAIITTEQA